MDLMVRHSKRALSPKRTYTQANPLGLEMFLLEPIAHVKEFTTHAPYRIDLHVIVNYILCSQGKTSGKARSIQAAWGLFFSD